MAIKDDRFKQLLEGAPFDNTTTDEEELFFERINNELNKWGSDSEYLDAIDTYFADTIRDIDSRIDKNIGAIQGYITINTGTQITANQVKEIFNSTSLDETSLKRKRQYYYNVAKNTPQLDEALLISNVIANQIRVDSNSQSAVKYNLSGGGAKIKEEALKKTLEKITPPPDDTNVTSSLPESITAGFTKQCVLMANIGTLYDHYYDRLYDQVKFKSTQDKYLAMSGKYLYGGNIVPVNINNPEYLIPFMTSPRQIFTGFLNGIKSRTAFNNKLKNNIEICFVKKVDGEVHEFPFISSNKSPDGDYNSLIQYMVDNGYGDTTSAKDYYRNANAVVKKELQKNWISSQGGGVGGNVYKFDSFDISFEGTNPSTARNDVKVKLSFTLTNLNVINKQETLISKQDSDKTQNFTLADLVKYPFYDNEASGGGKLFRSQYDPNHNRIRIYLSTDYIGNEVLSPAQQVFLRDNVLALDLTLVDHEFSKSGDGLNTAVTYTVNYRGYSESLLSTPLMDALVTKDRIKERIDREEILKKAVTENCSLSEVQKIIGELNAAAAAEANAGYDRIITNLQSGKRIYQATIGTAASKAITKIYRPQTEEEKKQGKNVTASSTAAVAQATGTLTLTKTSQTYDTDSVGFDESGANQIYFFYLFDLLDVITDNLYNRSGTGTNFQAIRLKDRPSDFVKDNNHRFFLGPISVPIYNGSGTITRKLINLGNLPISVEYFIDWYKENVTDKQLSFFPITSFIRQIFERLVTNMLHEFCFNDNLDSKVLIRTSIFEDSKYTNYDGTDVSTGNTISEAGYYGLVSKFFWNKQFFEFNDHWDFDNKNLIKTLQPLFQVDPKKGVRLDNRKPITCIVIYAQGRSDIYSTDLITKMETDATMPIVDVTNPNFSWYLKNWSFSRVSQQGLREARYFNSSLNSITQLAAVYDITLTFTKVIPTFFPGQIFKVLLNELGSVPSDPNGLPYQLGLGGYHLVTKVSHAYSTGAIYDPQITTSVTMRWFSSGSKQELLRQVLVDTKVTDPAQAITDAACDELTKYAQEISSEVAQQAQRGTLGASNVTEQNVAQRFESAASEFSQQFGTSIADPVKFKETILTLANSVRSSGGPLTAAAVAGPGGTYTYTYNKADDVVEIKDSTGKITAKLDKNNQIIEE